MKMVLTLFVLVIASCLLAAAPLLPTPTPNPYPNGTPTHTPYPTATNTPYGYQPPTPLPTWTPGPTNTPCSPYCPPPTGVDLTSVGGTKLSSPLFPILLVGLILFLVGLLDRLVLRLRGKQPHS